MLQKQSPVITYAMAIHKICCQISYYDKWQQTLTLQLCWTWSILCSGIFNPLNPELNPICYLLALLAHHFLHVSRIMIKSLTLRLLMSYIYIYDISSLRVNTGWGTGDHPFTSWHYCVSTYGRIFFLTLTLEK